MQVISIDLSHIRAILNMNSIMLERIYFGHLRNIDYFFYLDAYILKLYEKLIEKKLLLMQVGISI